MKLEVRYVGSFIDITCDEDPYKMDFETICEKVEKDGGEDYRLFVKKCGDIYHFGAIQLVDNYEAKAGYIWSSSASVMNKQFGLKLVDVCINKCSGYALDVDTIKPMMEKYWGYPVEVKTTETGNDVKYKFVKVGD